MKSWKKRYQKPRNKRRQRIKKAYCTDLEVFCRHCGEPAVEVRGKDIFPDYPETARRRYWICEPCEARVGCHPKSNIPLGELATKGERAMRKRAHDVFDRMWKSGQMSRDGAYAWLSSVMNIDFADCHIGEFDSDQCLQVINEVQRYLKCEY